MIHYFSALSRGEQFNKLTDEEYELLVVGGGITGAGIALDAALRGIKTVLVDMQDFAEGTSSRSTKLIHGGLRYLKQGEIREVAKLGQERAIVHRNGPHLTMPVPMLLPIYRDGTFGKLSTSAGLFAYDKLAKVKKTERRKMLSKKETIHLEPLLKKARLAGGGLYVEYRTDDARLTIEVIKSAVQAGAICTNYAKVVSLLNDEAGKIFGAKITDMLTGKTHRIRAKVIVNATGPWVEAVRNLDQSTDAQHRLKLTKGVHIVIDQSVFPLKQSVYFDAPDGRMIFAIPRDGKTYVGTTDTFYSGDPAQSRVLQEDRDYLINCIQFMFPSVEIKNEHIESSWSGLRPLIYEQGKDPSEISRKDEIWTSTSGLITIAGGKLTGYRKMAEEVVALVEKRLKQFGHGPYSACKTKNHILSGGHIGGAERLNEFAARQSKRAPFFGLTESEGERLARLYGSNADAIFHLAAGADQSMPRMLYGQLMYAVYYEMATNPSDLFIRRTGDLYFNIKRVQKWSEQVLLKMAGIFQWGEADIENYRRQLQEEISDAVGS